jgi:hypothetical protein
MTDYALEIQPFPYNIPFPVENQRRQSSRKGSQKLPLASFALESSLKILADPIDVG